MIDTKPTVKEIDSYIEAYLEAPWGELDDYADARSYLAHFYQHRDGCTWTYSEFPSDSPYLYVYGKDYGHNISQMMEQEFTGELAYWRATDISLIENALAPLGSVFYISNMHADRRVQISSSNKPRLKILPELVEEIFRSYESASIVLYTHRSTRVFNAICELDKDKYSINAINYIAESVQAKRNSNHQIDYLTMLVISRKA